MERGTERGFRRRDFFKVVGASGATAASVIGCSDKPEKLIPLLVPPDNIEYAPGNPVDYATTCNECPAGCGMVMRTREGRAIKAEGNPDHPVSGGALCARGQASLQTLYNPARIGSAMLREGDTWVAAEWDAAEAQALQALQRVTNPSRIVLMTDRGGGTRGQLIDQWLRELGAGEKIVLDPFGLQSIREANLLAFGRSEVPQYQIDRATLLVNFGSDFLETWISPVQQNRQFAEMHAADDKSRTRGSFVQVGPHVSLTGANADEWLSVRPGSETLIALALAGAVMERTGRSLTEAEPEQERLEQYLAPYTIARAAEAAGIEGERLEQLAEAISRAERPLALAGGTPLAHDAATDAQLAVNLLNYVSGAIGETVQFGATEEIDLSTPYSEVMAAVERMQAGQVDVLIVDGVNLIYQIPSSTGVSEALSRVKTIISLSSAWDETTSQADIVLPGLTAYERWGDAFPQRGVFGLMQPVMAPVVPVKAPEDTLISLGQALGLVGFADTGDFRDYLMTAWREIQREAGSREEFETFWHDSLRNGGVFRRMAVSTIVRLNLDALSSSPRLPSLSAAAGELVLLPTPSLLHRGGEGATKPWLQEVPNPISQVVWDSWADINPDTAKKMGIRHGDRILLKTSEGEIETAAYLHYGVHRDVIAIPLGQGRMESGRTADGRGVKVLDLLPSKVDPASGAFAYLSTVVTVSALEGKAFLVQTDGSPRQYDRGIIQTISREQFAAGEKPAVGHHGGDHTRPLDFYPPRADTPGYYVPYRWGMTVDTDRCTGCSACVVACYAENNIPVVGKERAALGREMSWLRIDRFLEGEGDDYRTLMQPMFCQQCENAGCEPVCPVYATYHTPDGLNAQVYNRCVGTRYCSNNCAYKVRRFNWFNYEWDEPLQLQLNPDVSVRSKGVMEKCTFCVQRIHRARYAANAAGRDIQDGEVTPACVQTCPTNALTFGNLSDKNSAVSRKALREEDQADLRVRQYEVFPELANKPAVTYLRRVADIPQAHHSEGA